MKDALFIKLGELIIKCNDGTAAAEEITELEKILTEEAEAVDYYVDFLIELNIFNQRLQIQLPDDASAAAQFPEEMPFDSALWKTMARLEKEAPPVPVPHTRIAPKKEELSERKIERVQHNVNKFAAAVSILSLAALFFVIALVRIFPEEQLAAVLTDDSGANWISARTPEKGSQIFTWKDSLYLSRGIAKFETAEEVELIIEGPAEFSFLDSSKIRLDLGKLCARVSESGLGFTVLTPNSQIIDLGTEFGVEVEGTGSTMVHMFCGKTLIASRKAEDVKEKLFLEKGAAAYVDGTTGRLSMAEAENRLFVRHLDSKNNMVWKGQAIDLADIAGGGNGIGTGIRGSYIDASTGKWFERSSIAEVHAEGSRQTDFLYHLVSSNPYVDGVFVPDGERGPIKISSKNHMFENAPDTSGTSWGGVINVEKVLNRRILLKDTVYGTNENPAIFMHANAGVTFDLENIRASMPGRRLTAFTAEYGISDTYPDVVKQPCADFRVLVDGQERFVREKVRALQGGSIDVPLTDSDRFLTLITTDSGKDAQSETGRASFNDWCVFGRPQLTVE